MPLGGPARTALSSRPQVGSHSDRLPQWAHLRLALADQESTEPMAKILVVDDAAFMRLRAAKLLAEAGHTVVEAENGRAAVEAYTRDRPDCVLMDITMPEMDGLEALAAIREHDPSARV